MTEQVPVSKKTDLRKLKRFVKEALPPNWILRDMILDEEDAISTTDFCAKLTLWLKLLRREGHA